MNNRSAHESTRDSLAVKPRDLHAAADMLPMVYDELRRLAQQKLSREPPGHTLQPTALVHEAFMRIVEKTDPGWKGHGHFFAAAAEAMRRILIERARRYARQKHGGGRQRVELFDHAEFCSDRPDDLLTIDEALTRLECTNPRQAGIVKLRFFAGLTIEETAAAIGVSRATVKSDWNYAKAWLHREIASVDAVTSNKPRKEEAGLVREGCNDD